MNKPIINAGKVRELTNLNEMLQLSYETLKQNHREEIDKLTKQSEQYYAQWQHASNELKRLRDERSKNISYTLNDNEMASFKLWRDTTPCMKNSLAHQVEFSFHGSGIGTCVKVSCGLCNSSKDITDVGSW